ncbi:MAG: IPT/TIG domain-containing protein [Spirochaetaceae bacterium]|jgi:hypothetical protein|nr:IPT/TIG domain-containing protein [Spirochaetaceae bacterium]
MLKSNCFYYSKFVFILSMAFCALSCFQREPKIIDINPLIGRTGDTIAITGENFGTEKNESYVSFGSVIPTLSSYNIWSDNLIVVRVPDFGESGLIYIYKNDKKSNPVLFSTEEGMPVFPDGDTADILPFIDSIEPKQTTIGGIIKITGSHFGARSENNEVVFFRDVEKNPSSLSDSGNPEYIKVKSADCLLWNEHEISLRVPDGAAGGNIEVHTKKGTGNKSLLIISGKPGEKRIKDKKTYAISYSVNIRVEKASLPNTLFLAVPEPPSTASQRNAEVLMRNAIPFISDYRGVQLYKFSDLKDNAAHEVLQSFLIDVYALETKVDTRQVKNVQDSVFREKYLVSNTLVNARSSEIQSQASLITGRETNPYLKARAIYQAMLKEDGNDFRSAIRFCELCRAADIPAIPVAGVLVLKNKVARAHLWNMFWIDGLGWIPVDINLGKALAPQGFNLPENPSDYYFGNIDNNRIIFSYGETILLPMALGNRTSSGNREYALQNIWEEVSGGLEAYSSSWSEIEITGVY